MSHGDAPPRPPCRAPCACERRADRTIASESLRRTSPDAASWRASRPPDSAPSLLALSGRDVLSGALAEEEARGMPASLVAAFQ